MTPNAPAACLLVLAASAALIAAAPLSHASLPDQSPPDQPTSDIPYPTSSDSLAPWRERAARAQSWLKAKAGDAEQAAAATLARARRELLGVEGEVHAATMAVATRLADKAGPDLASLTWVPVGAPTGSAAASGAGGGQSAPDHLKLAHGAASEIVVLVHGLDEPGTIWDELAPVLLDCGAAVVRFDYPNDQALCESARNLLDALVQLEDLGVERVSIVAHSMGGLVVRDALTREDGYDGDGRGIGKGLPAVQRLIMVGTPNHGSRLAPLQAVAEAREQVVRRVQGTAADGSGYFDASHDGCGEAGRDLCIGSEFLKALNARPLPAHVQLTTIRGVMTPAKASEYLRSEAAGQWAAWLGDERASALVEQACAAVQTLGDGMVAADSTRLEGVEDHVEVEADHRSILKRWTILKKLDELRGRPSPPAAAIPLILDRLGLADEKGSRRAAETAE